ncbi:MAG: hypothetical protein R6W48_02890 [Gaiellaceae bacterium]
MKRRTVLVGRGCLVLCIGLLALAAAGCGGADESTPATDTTTATAASSFTPAQVEKMITRTIEPTLDANLGKGYTMTVVCTEAEPGFRCEYQAFSPMGKPVADQRVMYAVTCDVQCSWFPIG